MIMMMITLLLQSMAPLLVSRTGPDLLLQSAHLAPTVLQSASILQDFLWICLLSF